VVDLSGNLFVSNFGTETANNTSQPGVYEYLYSPSSPTGFQTTPTSFYSALFNHPLGLASGPPGDGHIYIANFGDYATTDGGVLQLDPSLGGVLTVNLSPNPGINPKYVGFIENCTTNAFIEVCKTSSTTNPVKSGGIYKFTVSGSAFDSSTNPLMVPVGECSGPIPVTAPAATITELPTRGVGVSEIAAVGYSPPPNSQEENLLESYDLQTATATVLLTPPATAGDTSTETIATFTNYESPPGQLKICKVAGPGVTVLTKFSFTVNNGATFTVKAGPEDQGGYCVERAATYPVGTYQTVAETTTGYATPTVTVNGVSTPGVACTATTYCVMALIGPGINEVSFTNSQPDSPRVESSFTGLDIVHYSLVKQTAVSGRQSYRIYRADLLNRGTAAMGPITAKVTSRDPASVQVVGQGALKFTAVPANGQAGSSGTFTILADPAVPVDFSKLSWTFQSTRSISVER